MNKINKIDLTILILGTFEILHVEDTPKKVVLNEMINLAKKFGSGESNSFINGVLDTIANK